MALIFYLQFQVLLHSLIKQKIIYTKAQSAAGFLFPAPVGIKCPGAQIDFTLQADTLQTLVFFAAKGLHGPEAINTQLGQILKRLLYIYACLGAAQVHLHVMLLLKLLQYRLNHLGLGQLVNLVSDQYNLDTLVSVFPYFLQPVGLDTFEGFPVAGVEYDYYSLGVLVICAGDVAETLLAGGVPNLQFNQCLVDLQCSCLSILVLELEIDTNRRVICLLKVIVSIPFEQTGFSSR